MDKNVYELIKDIELQRENINNWEQITNIFVNSIKRRGLSEGEVEKVNNIIIKGIKNEELYWVWCIIDIKDKMLWINYFD